MRITKLFLTIAVLTLFTKNSFAHENPTETTVRNEIKEMIQESANQFDETNTLIINFMVNSQNKIIIISTNSEANEMKIRSILNLKKVNSNDLIQNKLYTLPIQIKKM